MKSGVSPRGQINRGDIMALDRWIGLILLGIFAAYGYAAWFSMDGSLAPFMRRNPIWPSTFPKVVSIMGIVVGLIIVRGLEKSDKPREENPSVIVYRQLKEFKLGQAGLLLGLMVAYALLLRPAGFIIATLDYDDRRCWHRHRRRLVSCAGRPRHLPPPPACIHGGVKTCSKVS